MISCRGTFISEVSERISANSYLEIGLSKNPKAPYRVIELENKKSVDMNPETNPDYCMSSDEFFHSLKSGWLDLDSNTKWDIIFIDGNHLANQVYKDLCNSIDHLSENGIIFLHDSLPWSYDMTIESDVGNRMATCQDAWKVIEFLLKERDDLHVCTILESGGGLGVVTKCKNSRPLLDREYNRFYQFIVYNENKYRFMNTIEGEHLIEWVKNPTYAFSQ